MPHDSEWPRVLKISFEAEEVQLSQGKGHGLGGSCYDFDEFDVSEWTFLFDGWETDWLVEALSAHDSLASLDEAAFVRTLQRHVSLVTEAH